MYDPAGTARIERSVSTPRLLAPVAYTLPRRTSFACATVLSHYAPRLRVPFFVLAALIAFSRVYNAMHYPTDVLAGAVLGVGIGTALIYAARRWGERGRYRRLER